MAKRFDLKHKNELDNHMEEVQDIIFRFIDYVI